MQVARLSIYRLQSVKSRKLMTAMTAEGVTRVLGPNAPEIVVVFSHASNSLMHQGSVPATSTPLATTCHLQGLLLREELVHTRHARSRLPAGGAAALPIDGLKDHGVILRVGQKRPVK